MIHVLRDPSMTQGCNSISRCVVGPGAAVVNCGLVSCSHPATETSSGSRFANGLSVVVGPETRGRELACYATMSLAEASAAAVDRTSPEAVKEHRMAVDEYAELARYARVGQEPNQHLAVYVFFCSVITTGGDKERRGRLFWRSCTGRHISAHGTVYLWEVRPVVDGSSLILSLRPTARYWHQGGVSLSSVETTK